MREYREFSPPPHLAEPVECCWVSAGAEGSHRVLPDGCADIIFRFRNGRPELLAVGAMTRYADLAEAAGSPTVGTRFRPGMWARVLNVEAGQITDQTVPLEELWGPRAREVTERLANGHTAEERAGILAHAVGTVDGRTPIQRAIGLLEMRRGLVSLDYLAREAGVSTRQFRRICVRETGLTPKLLARILRFRHAALRAASETGAHAGLAAECGYADQAHMIAEFKRFGGRTPCGL